jgi:hypothetical protein
MKKISLIAAMPAAILALPAHAAEAPRLAQRDGLHALLVDGKPFLMLGGQAHQRTQAGVEPGPGVGGFTLRVEEGRFDDKGWQMERVRNGDQVDLGLNLTAEPIMLKVQMARTH